MSKILYVSKTIIAVLEHLKEIQRIGVSNVKRKKGTLISSFLFSFFLLLSNLIFYFREIATTLEKQLRNFSHNIYINTLLFIYNHVMFEILFIFQSIFHILM